MEYRKKAHHRHKKPFSASGALLLQPRNKGDAPFWEGTLVGVEAENPLEAVARRQEATELNRIGCDHWSLGTDESQGSWGGDPVLNPCSGSHEEV